MQPALPLAALSLALVPLWLLWGFSVDDAWIVSRVAEHLAAGEGPRFNLGEPATDAVTPLGFAHLVALVGAVGHIDPFLAARGLGLLAWLGCLGRVALELGRERAGAVAGTGAVAGAGAARLVIAALGFASLVPLHAWAGAGLETPVVACSFLWGALGVRGRAGADSGWANWPSLVALAFAAAWRPELTPAAVTAAALLPERAPRGRRIGQGSSVLVGPLLVAAIRLASFGVPWPLSSVAKAPALELGFRYAVGGLLLAGPVAWIWARSARAGWLRPASVVAAHSLAMMLCGGDWMPFFRLWVPVLPWLVCEAVCAGAPAEERTPEHATERTAERAAPTEARRVPARQWWGAGWALACALLLLLGMGEGSGRVLERRERWVELARPALKSARVVAAVDIGWVGRATEARLVDLGGVTDPTIARLPGGHTTKRLGAGLLSARNVDTWIVRVHDMQVGAELDQLHPVYGTDQVLLRGAVALGFVIQDSWVLPESQTSYVIATDPRLTPGLRPSAPDDPSR
ncbi:MAG TPA: hypothetical protein VLC09_18760 [Polyangiaceae bacterium]|nr:hypothetical protein [Polyangiaceae bacterium]